MQNPYQLQFPSEGSGRSSSWAEAIDSFCSWDEPPVTEESATGQAFSLEAENTRKALLEPLAARTEARHQSLWMHTPDFETKITV